MKGKALRTKFDRHPVTAYINSLTSDSSKRSMLSALKSVFALALGEDPRNVDPLVVYNFAWVEISPARVKAIKAALLERYSRRMAAKCLAAVKGVINSMLDDTSLISKTETYMRLQRAKAVKGISVAGIKKAGRKLSGGEIMALARVCAEDKSPAGARDDAILGLGITQGPRVSELAGLQLKDYDPATGDLTIQNGKGGKSRTIRAANATKTSLDEWIDLRGDEEGPLFCRVNKAGRIHVAPMSKTALDKMLKRRAAQAGVKPFSAHDLRRTFLTNGWAAGIPGVYLQRIAGHATLSTTSAYDRSDIESALKSSERLHYPSARAASKGGGPGPQVRTYGK